MALLRECLLSVRARHGTGVSSPLLLDAEVSRPVSTLYAVELVRHKLATVSARTVPLKKSKEVQP
jgi:hypothetical protein